MSRLSFWLLAHCSEPQHRYSQLSALSLFRRISTHQAVEAESTTLLTSCKALAITVSLLLAGGCAFPGVYKIDVQQGSIVERETAESLEVGMSRSQVRYLLGTPLLEPTFSNDYENYLYTIQLSGGEIRQQQIQLEYEGDQLSRIAKLELLPVDLANPGLIYKRRGVRDTETLVEESTITQTRGQERRL